MKKEQVLKFISANAAISQGISGLITKRETVFLSLLPLISVKGEILEIGSYTGKSTIILARSAQFAGISKIFACDPFLLESSTDPDVIQKDKVEDLFYENLKKYNVENTVEFSKMKSEELALKWNRPIKVLWIDGDHTYESVKKDFDNFIGHCVKGSIVCLHDVLHAFDGPIRIFTEQILLSDNFGDCGLIGSLGWAQFLGDEKPTGKQWKKKLKLYKKLTRIIPVILKMNNNIKTSKLGYNLLRILVPHGKKDPLKWLAERSASQF